MSTRPSGWRVVVLGALLAVGGAWQAVLILVLLAAVLWAEEAVGALVRAAGAVRERVRQRRELDRKWLELEAARQGQAPTGPCAHEHPEDVRDLAGTLVATLCPQCEAQLPPDFEVVKGDR